MSEHNRPRRQMPYDWRRLSSQEQVGTARRTRRHVGLVEAIIIGIWSWFAVIFPGRAGRGGATAERRAMRTARPAGRRNTRPTFGRVVLLGVGVFVLGLLVARIVAPSAPRSAASETQGPHLAQPAVAWYAPDGEVFGVVAAQTTYEPLARYGEGWVQVEFAEHGQLWVESSTLPELNIDQLTDLLPPVDGYRTYTVAPGDTLRLIAGIGGSDAALIRRYNRLQGEPVPGQPLIVPHLSELRNFLPQTPLLIKHGHPEQPAVALTIDLETGDAPVQQMLEVLRTYDARITIFVLGTWVEQHPDLARQIIADGHELANHSLSHPDFVTLTNEQIAHELAETERLVQEITGSTTRPFFRPPYGSYDDRVLLAAAEQGYLTIYWSIDSGDAAGAEKTLDYVLQQMTGAEQPQDLHGAIILAHCCNRTTTVEALPDVLKRFGEMGILVRPLSVVLGS